MYNKAIIIGRSGSDPKERFTPEGLAVVTINVATTSRRRVNGESVEETQWHECVAFGKVAEAATKFATKGSLICVEGSFRSRKYVDKNNIERVKTEILVDRLVRLVKPTAKHVDEAQLPMEIDKQSAADNDDDVPF